MSRPSNKTNQWKSMPIHQGWFNLLHIIPLLVSQTTEFVICISIYIRDSAPSHYFPLPEVSSRDLDSRPETWTGNYMLEGNSCLAVDLFPPLPPNVSRADQRTIPVSGKACSPTKGGLICYICNLYSYHKLPSL